jgi:clan AA aspartic protease
MSGDTHGRGAQIKIHGNLLLEAKEAGILRFSKHKRCDRMGITQVTAVVRNPARPDRTWEGLFLVDTGSVDCLVPAKHLKAIGLEPEGQRTYELADGTAVKLDVAVAKIEFMGDIVGVTVIFGQEHAEPILGVTALESVGIEVDPRNQRLKRLPAIRLK